VGRGVGAGTGLGVGAGVGLKVGTGVGLAVGALVGADVGAGVGLCVGAGVGTGLPGGRFCRSKAANCDCNRFVMVLLSGSWMRSLSNTRTHAIQHTDNRVQVREGYCLAEMLTVH
jgi:hypothetical protein